MTDSRRQNMDNLRLSFDEIPYPRILLISYGLGYCRFLLFPWPSPLNCRLSCASSAPLGEDYGGIKAGIAHIQFRAFIYHDLVICVGLNYSLLTKITSCLLAQLPSSCFCCLFPHGLLWSSIVLPKNSLALTANFTAVKIHNSQAIKFPEKRFSLTPFSQHVLAPQMSHPSCPQWYFIGWVALHQV
jgi:hypothetical protein